LPAGYRDASPSEITFDVTWDAGYTEAPDETAHGDYMKLMASAGLAFDYVHLQYLVDGDLRIARTEREANGYGQKEKRFCELRAHCGPPLGSDHIT
jgi:hypothetical protein